ncbi:MAG: hypothetical protein AB7E05_04525 [Sphingobium sp.]
MTGNKHDDSAPGADGNSPREDGEKGGRILPFTPRPARPPRTPATPFQPPEPPSAA